MSNLSGTENYNQDFMYAHQAYYKQSCMPSPQFMP